MKRPLGLAALALCLLAGCGGADLADARARYLLQDEPANAIGVLDARETGVTGRVVLVGRVGGVPDPWSKGKAAFVISDPTAGDDVHACTDPGCPFCANKREAGNEAIAVVQFLDERGKVLPLDARELFGLDTQQTVVVSGHARVDDLGSLVLSADGLYIRR